MFNHTLTILLDTKNNFDPCIEWKSVGDCARKLYKAIFVIGYEFAFQIMHIQGQSLISHTVNSAKSI